MRKKGGKGMGSSIGAGSAIPSAQLSGAGPLFEVKNEGSGSGAALGSGSGSGSGSTDPYAEDAAKAALAAHAIAAVLPLPRLGKKGGACGSKKGGKGGGDCAGSGSGSGNGGHNGG